VSESVCIDGNGRSAYVATHTCSDATILVHHMCLYTGVGLHVHSTDGVMSAIDLRSYFFQTLPHLLLEAISCAASAAGGRC